MNGRGTRRGGGSVVVGRQPSALRWPHREPHRAITVAPQGFAARSSSELQELRLDAIPTARIVIAGRTLKDPDAALTEERDADAIHRSPRKLDRTTLARLLSLHQKQPWLERRQAELFELLELCQDIDEQDLICDLLYRFTYLDPPTIASAISKISDHIVVDRACTPSNTIITAINRSKYSDSSEYILWQMKPIISAKAHGWSTNNFVSDLSAAIDMAAEGTNIVLIDEFVGSGGTISKAAKKISDTLSARHISAEIVICSVAAMIHAKEKIELAGFSIFSTMWLKRGISDHYTDGDLSLATSMMQRLESSLGEKSDGRKLSEHTFGWKHSEALYYLEGGNPPNNNFPIFWWKTLRGDIIRAPILTRIS